MSMKGIDQIQIVVCTTALASAGSPADYLTYRIILNMFYYVQGTASRPTSTTPKTTRPGRSDRPYFATRNCIF